VDEPAAIRGMEHMGRDGSFTEEATDAGSERADANGFTSVCKRLLEMAY